jgi:hypothetical protein
VNAVPSLYQTDAAYRERRKLATRKWLLANRERHNATRRAWRAKCRQELGVPPEKRWCACRSELIGQCSRCQWLMNNGYRFRSLTTEQKETLTESFRHVWDKLTPK